MPRGLPDRHERRSALATGRGVDLAVGAAGGEQVRDLRELGVVRVLVAARRFRTGAGGQVVAEDGASGWDVLPWGTIGL